MRLKNLPKFLITLGLLMPLFAYAAFTPTQGGTGIGSDPGYGQVLVGNHNNGYTLTATSSLGISGGGGGGVTTGTFPLIVSGSNMTFNGVSTSSNPTVGQNVYWTGINTLGTEATGTIGASGGITISGTPYVLNSATTIGCTVATNSVPGCMSAADHTTLSGAQAAISVTYPITLTGAALSFTGLSTSSNAVTGNIPYFSGVNTFANIATSSESCTSPVSCTGFYVLGTGGGAISLGTVGVATGGTGQTAFGQGWLGINNAGAFFSSTSPTINYFTSTSTTATSSINTGGFTVGGNSLLVQQGTGLVGIGTSTPGDTLTVNGTISAVSAATNARIYFNANVGSFGSMSATNNIGSANIPLIFQQFGSTIGVGNTTTPWAQLSINGFAGATTPLFTISSSTASFATSTAFIVNSNGQVGIGTSSPSGTLAVAGGLFVVGSSTAMNGINITNGCFAISGSCIGGGSGGVTSIKQTNGSAQTGAISFATSSNQTNGLLTGFNITNSGGAFTFTATSSGVLQIAGGGTSISTTPNYGQLLVGNNSNGYTLSATNTLGIALSDTTGTLAINRGGTALSSTPTYGQLLIGNNASGYTLSATNTLGVALSDTTGTLPINRGGTATTTYYSGGLTYYDGTEISQPAQPQFLHWDNQNNRLGIGTTTPAERLHIYADANNFTTMRFDSGTTQGYFFAYSGDTSVNLGSLSNAQVNFKQNNNTVGYFDTSGNLNIQNSGGNSSILQLIAPSSAHQESTFGAIRTFSTNNYEESEFTNEDYGTDHLGSITESSKGTGTTTPFGIRFWRQNDGAVNQFGKWIALFDPSGATAFGGFSTTTYDKTIPFQIASTTATTLFQISKATTTVPVLDVLANGTFGLGSSTPWGDLSVAGAAGGTAPLFTISSSTAAFATTTAFFIDSNGNVGIGTTTFNGTLGIAKTTGTGLGSSTIATGKIQIDGYNSAGTRTCTFEVGTVWVIISKACTQ